MSLSTSKLITNKSILIKYVLTNILADIQENNLASLRDRDKSDLERAISSCDEIIDLSKFVGQNAAHIQNLNN